MGTLIAGAPNIKITGTIATAYQEAGCNMRLFMKFAHDHIQCKKNNYIRPADVDIHETNFRIKLNKGLIEAYQKQMNCY